jgi:predicted ArsR family transcriptional regulator
MTTATATPTTQKLLAALSETPQSNAADLAAITGLGRSTVSKQLAALEKASAVKRTPGARDRGRRLPDRWSLPDAQATAGAAGGRLRPGQLDTLVLDHMQTIVEPVGPVAVARALGRSTGAVANCMARLTKTRKLRLVDDRPRRYRSR